MRIAQIAPLYESVPPYLYGGTERVVSYLTEELVRLGHDVTLFASGDSVSSARLVPACDRSLRLCDEITDSLAYHILLLDKVFAQCDEFDVLHFHTDYIHFPLLRHLKCGNITTLHGRLDIPDLQPVYRHFNSAPLVSISFAQRGPLEFASWVGNVYHGLPRDLLSLREGSGGYLAFLGRFSPEKRPDRAIRIALRTGIPLKMAAKIDRADRAYFENVVKPLLANPGIEYVGEITESEKSDFLGNACAYLFPIDWPEPFGLTTIEAMACGTPTVAFRCGSVPELIEHDVTGYIVDSEDEAVHAVKRIEELDRTQIRSVFEERFTATRMAEDYLDLYEQTIRMHSPSHFEATASAGSRRLSP
ncbi:MAG TPA: glycosyltransferase family 4 protein [Candidatus Acidoferrum sp.]|jgi:glycosyltransferase involved in cell wall biosynthesis|nr:glycosyltransferase family 4 protein [Candidatus Acidoferrum sp.]